MTWRRVSISDLFPHSLRLTFRPRVTTALCPAHIRVEWLASTSLISECLLLAGLSFCHLMMAAGGFHFHAPRSTCFALHNKKSSCLLLLLVYTSPDTIRRKINWSQVVVMLSRQKKLFTCSALRQHRPPPSSVYVSSFVPSKNVD